MLSKLCQLSGILLIVLIAFGIYAEGCELDQMRHGCRIYGGQCSCGYGCKSEFRYDSNDECRLVLRGKREDICSRTKPCLNGGSCLQILTGMGFKCLCEGTGYYGTRCEKICPRPNAIPHSGSLPYECVVI